MTTSLAIVSQKGGVGKTTVALHLALSMAASGRRVLLVDVDPQGGLGHLLAKADSELSGLADVLAGRATPGEAVIVTRQAGLSLLPRGRLDAAESCAFEVSLFQAGTLARVLATVADDHDVIVIDTPSGMGMATRAALRIADHALLLLQAEPLALRTIAQALQVIAHVREHENARLSLLGILPTMVDKTHGPSLDVLVEAWSELAGVLETIIPRADVFSIASQAGVPVGYLGGPPSPEARRFDLLADEIDAILHASNPESRHAVPRRQLL